MTGDHFILWTTQEGGFFNGIRGATQEQYDEAVATGILRVRRWDCDDERYDEYPLAFIAYGPIEANHDFVIGGARDDPEAIAKYRASH